MDIYDIELREIKVGGFNLEDIDGLCHVKSLPYLSVVRVVEGNYFSVWTIKIPNLREREDYL